MNTIGSTINSTSSTMNSTSSTMNSIGSTMNSIGSTILSSTINSTRSTIKNHLLNSNNHNTSSTIIMGTATNQNVSQNELEKSIVKSDFLNQLQHDLFIIKNRNYLDKKLFYKKQKNLYLNMVSNNPLQAANSTFINHKISTPGGSAHVQKKRISNNAHFMSLGIGTVIDPKDNHKPNHAKLAKSKKSILNELLENQDANHYLKDLYKTIGEKANAKTRHGRKYLGKNKKH